MLNPWYWKYWFKLHYQIFKLVRIPNDLSFIDTWNPIAIFVYQKWGIKIYQQLIDRRNRGYY